jgi:hypothetical protein
MNANTTTASNQLEPAIKFAGFALSHAIWSVSDGATLCTLAFTENENERRLYRFEADSISKSVEIANQKLSELQPMIKQWALVYDGYMNLNSEKVDALIVQLWSVSQISAKIVQKYKSAKYWRGFKVLGNPMFIDATGSIIESKQFQDWLLEGILQHPKVARLWKKWFQPA